MRRSNKARRPGPALLMLTAMVIALLSGGTTAAVAAPTAAPKAVTPAASCELEIGVTHRSGNTIIGFGSQSNCGTSGQSVLTIQRLRTLDIWENLSSATVVGSGHDVFVNYNCTGTGTHTFRTIHQGVTIGGSSVVKVSNSIRETC